MGAKIPLRGGLPPYAPFLQKPRFQGPLVLGLRPPKAFLEKAAIIAINLFRRQTAVFRRGLRLASRCPRSQPLHHGAGASSAEVFPPAGFLRLPQVLFLNPRVLSAGNCLYRFSVASVSHFSYLVRISSFINSAQKLNQLPEKARQFGR